MFSKEKSQFSVKNEVVRIYASIRYAYDKMYLIPYHFRQRTKLIIIFLIHLDYVECLTNSVAEWLASFLLLGFMSDKVLHGFANDEYQKKTYVTVGISYKQCILHLQTFQ